MELIYQAVKNVIIFLLLVTVLGNLLGQSSFKKYINIFVGLVLIIIVITPILKLINSNAKVDQFYNQNLYRMSASDLGEQLLSADKSYQGTILKEYKKTMEEQIEATLKSYKLTADSVDITINEDADSEECGQITAISVKAKKEEAKKESEQKENTLDVDEVDKVTIEKIDINDADKAAQTTGEQNKDKYDTVEELTVKEELSALYGIEQEHIEVDIT